MRISKLKVLPVHFTAAQDCVNSCRLWGTFLADVVIRSIGTDYARVVRAIYAFAQVHLCCAVTLHGAANI